MTNLEMQAWIKQKVENYLSTWNNKDGVQVANIPSKFNLKGRVAGYFCSRETGNFFRWNLDIALANQAEYSQTVGHEVAHLIVHKLSKLNHQRNKPHGTLWKVVMHTIGLPPKRCHDYACESARKVARPIERICSNCHATERMTITKYRNMLKTMNPANGEVNYVCRCGQKVNVLNECKPCVKVNQ